MPLARGQKRRAAAAPEVEADDASPQSSPEPPTQRRRLTPEDDAYANDNGGAANGEDSSQQLLVKKLLRLALACEYQRRPLRRAEIGEKVLSNTGGRRFREVFNATQVELKSVFGMELVELPGKERVTIAQKRAAQKSQSQAAKPVTAWILVSTLPPEFRDPAILPPPRAPTSEEESKYTAAYTLLVSLVSLSGGSLPDAKMERYLRRLGVEDNVPMGAPAGGLEKTEKLLKRMERDGYLVKVKEASGQGDDDIYWTVGPRGKVEVGESGVRGLTKAVYGDPEGEEQEELERKIARSLGLDKSARPGAAQNGGTRKRRGRKRREEDEEEEGDEARDEEEEDSSEEE